MAVAYYPDVYWRRKLPHWVPEDVFVFVTWRLAGTLPRTDDAQRARQQPPQSFEERFVRLDRELDTTPIGPKWLAIPDVANIVAEAIFYGSRRTHAYELQAWAIMPNHVHVVMKPKTRLDELMRWLKNATGVRANRILNRSGAFWQREYFDHWIRSAEELTGITDYVERNPEAAGLIDWRWSSSPAARPPALLNPR